MRSMLPDRDVLVRTIRIPAAHGSIPALLLLPRSSALTGCSASAMRTMPRPKRSFLKNGGVLEDERYDPEEAVTVRRYWIDLPK